MPGQASKRRIGGIDLARAVAMAGMIAAHVGPVTGIGFWGSVYALPSGRASILFVVLAGLGMTLLDGARQGPRSTLAVRWGWFAIVLLPLGLALQELDHGVWIVLHHYAALFLIGLAVMRFPSSWLLVAAVLACVVGSLVLLILRIKFPTLPVFEGVSITDPIGTVILGLTVTGPYPLITWASSFLFGMWLGRLDLRDERVRSGMITYGAALGILALVVSGALTFVLGPPAGPHEWRYLLVTDAHSQMPLWLIGSIASATLALGLCLIVADRLDGRSWPFQASGQVALTVYVGHILALHFFRGPAISQSVRVGTLLLAEIGVISIVFAVAWLSLFRRGPLELLLHAPLRLLQIRRGKESSTV